MASAAAARPVCVVTGGTSGIGLETARRFAREGFRIVACGRDRRRLDQARVSIGASPSDLAVRELDLARPREAPRLIEFAVNAFGRIDLLVLCAAVAPLRPIVEMSAGEFESTLDVDVRSLFYLTQAAWRQFVRQGNGGVIVNVSSLAAVDPFPGFSVYGACKAWGDLFCQALAAEGKPHGIRLHSIRPGAVETPMLRGLFPDFPADQALSPSAVAELIWAVYQEPFRHASGQTISIRM